VNKRRPRQVDVARHAGVSPAIVSLVLNGKTSDKIRISDQTVERVRASIRELGYMPNPMARSLATGHNRILGVFTYEPIFPLHTENFYFPFLVGIEDESEAQDYDLLLFTRSRREEGRRSVYRDGVNQLLMADGAILFGRDVARDEVERLRDEGYPFVSIGRVEAEGPVPYVAADYTGATFAVMEHLARHGHRRVAYLGAPDRAISYRDRERGYRLAVEELHLEFHEDRLRFQNPETWTADHLAALLATGATAVVCEGHRLAVSVLQVARELGLRVPRDFSFAVLGDHHGAIDALANATTFRIPLYEMGVRAVRMLTATLDGADTAQNVTLPCDFVPGHTVATPPS
jgi:DNA-binding LacI/PurR family transcriptional regulator